MHLGKQGKAVLLSLAMALVGCKGGEEPAPAAGQDPNTPPVSEGTWKRLGVETTWQWQLLGTVSTRYDVALYDMDLFDSDEALIRRLKSEGRIVICYFSAGSSENWRPDFQRFEASVLGKSLDGWTGERWLDVRAASVAEVMRARLDLAVSKGCDGVEPDNVDGYANDTGFPLTEENQLAFNRFLSNEAHLRGLTVGLKNTGELVPALVDYFDFSLNEQCHQYAECEALRPFLSAGKPVFNAEYADSPSQALSRAQTLCPKARAENLRTLVLPLALDDAFRVSCDESSP